MNDIHCHSNLYVAPLMVSAYLDFLYVVESFVRDWEGGSDDDDLQMEAGGKGGGGGGGSSISF